MNFHKTVGVAAIVSLSVLSLGLTAASGSHPAAGHPQAGAASPHCRPVRGMIMTNFGVITPTSTLGTATGDLQGAVSATLLGAPESGAGNTVIFHVQHHFVTGSGDVIIVDPAKATAVPISPTLFAVLTYPIHISGTGKFAGATGDITNIGEVRLPNAPVDFAGVPQFSGIAGKSASPHRGTIDLFCVDGSQIGEILRFEERTPPGSGRRRKRYPLGCVARGHE